ADPGETAKRDRERAPQAEKRRYHRSPAGARRGIGGNAPRFSARRGRNEDPRPRAPQQQRQRQAIDARRRGAPLKKDRQSPQGSRQAAARPRSCSGRYPARGDRAGSLSPAAPARAQSPSRRRLRLATEDSDARYPVLLDGYPRRQALPRLARSRYRDDRPQLAQLHARSLQPRPRPDADRKRLCER